MNTVLKIIVIFAFRSPMKKIRNIIFILLLLPLLGFSGDTTKLFPLKPSTLFFTASQFGNTDSISFINNSLTDFQNYISRHNLGNSGMAVNIPGRQFLAKETGFHYNAVNFRDYFYTKENLLFYDTHVPYSDILYVMGSKKEQDFKLTFSYNVKKNWNLSAHFFRIRSEGSYLRQNTNDNFLSLSTVYRSKNNKYNLLAGILFNYVQNLENGGIANDTVFEDGGTFDNMLLEVNLSAAKGTYRNRSIFVNQYLNFGKKGNDTASNAQIIPNSRLMLATTFDDVVIRYIDDFPTEGFYSNIYSDSLRTLDSTYNVKFENELSWKRLDNGKHRGFADKIGVGVKAKDQFVFTRQNGVDTTFNNIIAGAEMFNTYSDHKLWFNISSDYCLSGYNEGDYRFKGAIKKGILDSLSSVSLSAEAIQHAPDYIYNFYSSNNFKWENDFDKIMENTVHLNFSMPKYRLALNLNYKEITNPVYFDNYAIARQYTGTIPVASASLKKDFTFFNWHLNNTVLYQYVSDSVVIRLPEYILEHSLFYENDLFKKAMRFQIGASLFLVSNYYADRYMPATGQFYLQDDKKYGSYPFVDFFINAKVKAVRIFVKIDHLNSGWLANKYMLTAHYPMNDRTFKLGVSWRFFD